MFYGVISIFIGLATVFFYNKKFFSSIPKLFVVIFCYALLGGGLGSVFTYYLHRQSFGTGVSAPFAQYLHEVLGTSVFNSQLMADVVVDLFDKSVTVIVAIVAFHFISRRVKNYLNHVFQRNVNDKNAGMAVRYSLLGKALKVISVADDKDNSANVMAVLTSLLKNDGNTNTAQTLEKRIEDKISSSEAEELIQGVLRRGHKMLISGSSKAGKSFLLMELCISIAEGSKWLGFPCRQGKVLYVNLEIDPASCIHRFLKIYDALGIQPTHMENILIWNLRGRAVPLDQLVPKLVRRVQGKDLTAIVIDPIYKVITGDENSASDMAAFCNQFDRICTDTGCSVIYCHHHSKGTQGAKRAMDRASGSGVFARDPDAQLDMIELELTEDVKNWEAKHGATAWRLECSLREFENFVPVDFWFEYPIHRIDNGSSLCSMPTQGSLEAGRMKNSHSKSSETAATEFRNAFYILAVDGSASVQEMMAYLDISDKTVYARIKKLKDEFVLKKGRIFQVNDAE